MSFAEIFLSYKDDSSPINSGVLKKKKSNSEIFNQVSLFHKACINKNVQTLGLLE